MKKILVVDDSKTIRTICEWIYKGLEDRIITTDCASAALDIISRESPDVVVVDYTLPDRDSYEFVSQIKDTTRVVMMGGQYAPFSEEKALQSGAVLSIMKPFKSDTFFSAIENALNAEAAGAQEETVAEAVEAPVIEPVQPAPTSSVNPVVAPISSVSPVVAPTSSVSPIVAPTSSVSPAVPPIDGFVAPSPAAPAPISAVSAPAASASPLSPSLGSTVSPFAGAKRFNFPGQTVTPEAAPTQSGTPTSPSSGVSQNVNSNQITQVPFGNTRTTTSGLINTASPTLNSGLINTGSSPTLNSGLINTGATTNSGLININMGSSGSNRSIQRTESATPKSPVSGISPRPEQQQAPQAQIDPAVLRAEVIAAVKSILPAIVNSYLKKLIQAEVKPQLQNWVDARVEALLKKYLEK